MKTLKFSKEQRKHKLSKLSNKQLSQIIGGVKDEGSGDGGDPDYKG